VCGLVYVSVLKIGLYEYANWLCMHMRNECVWVFEIGVYEYVKLLCVHIREVCNVFARHSNSPTVDAYIRIFTYIYIYIYIYTH